MASVFLALLVPVVFLASPAPVAGKPPPAIFVFGDSTADVGNNNNLPWSNTRADFPPNGIDFPGGVPTGRFCNGFNLADLLAKKIGFEMSPPSSLSVLIHGTRQLEGVNFASGGSGILDTTGQNSSLSLNTQIVQFIGTTKSVIKQMGRKSAELFFSKAIFILSTGSNDLFRNVATFGRQSETRRKVFISLLTKQFKYQIKVLYGLGGRKFAFIGLGSIGCVPLVRAKFTSGGCSPDLNMLAKEFNEATQEMLSRLTSSCQGMKYSYVDSDAIGSLIFAKLQQFGFEEGEIACCGRGRFNGEAFCTPEATLCSNRRRFVFWDAVHPTQAYYTAVAKFAYDGNRTVARPINIRKLATI